MAQADTTVVAVPRSKISIDGETIPRYADIIDISITNFKNDNILRIAHACNETLIFFTDDT